MIRRLLPLAAFAVLFAHTASAQEISKKKGKLIGFSVNATDFKTPNDIKATSFKDTWKKGDWHNFKNHDFGFSLMYWQGITNKIDFSGRYNGLFTNYSKNGSSNQYSNEFEASLHARALNDNYTVNPFLTAGVGVGNYGSRWSPYAPLGIGAQVNIAGITYLFVQANYRLAFNQKKHDDNLFWSIGFTENISKPKKTEPVKTVPIPVIEAPKDTDSDGVVDSLDACPEIKGLPQFQGCPDTDGDGIADKEDKCPDVKGLVRYNGCPIPDTDGDGVNDEEDKCPNVAGVARYNGCPVPDTDKDGVNDEEDKCPNLPGPKENNGCPVVKEEVVKKVNVAAGKIFFTTGTAKLMAKSNASLNLVAAEMKKDADLKLSIEGHTDNTGTDKINQPLSEKRAQAVLAYLKAKGVEESRMTAAGFGSANPIADNKTAKGRTLNRRVELKLSY
jgi:OOP family OmpA-OmpF porin